MDSDMEMSLCPVAMSDNESWYKIASTNRSNVPIFFVEMGDEVIFLLDGESSRPEIKRSLSPVAVASAPKFLILFNRA